ncbi:transcriptional regulator, AsnC family [Paracoccus solventivorans]|uniref:Lrp/AsnC family transcriptional regulator n=1 Tax=Paracoccus solventivorans TaxID=53463 RepID=A0A1M7I2P6_9RHOB|nr:Lrp/AsnC family transcriptional regulator [Paracoccus solventivorans]SHM34687.1 transcriptional regulator, AsnC family [Paracoccus solventivorans]HHW35064.1 Lrp/AsnC family transcriptional regulator [Paracoccus solventivorans]HMM08816.1 Lrp/AsnC family transcriptional regulator [Paracoccus solventivorans]
MSDPQQNPVRLDALDRKILSLLQQDASLPLEEIAARAGASRTPVWNRIRRMREQGVIRGQVALLDAESLGLEACFFVLVRTTEHDADWAGRFLAAVRARPEVVEAHRLAGDIDYILKVVVRNARAYDRFYQSLISEVRIQNVTALLSMEEMKATHALPIPPG